MSGFGSHWKFLIVWNHTLQLFVYGYFVLFGARERKSHLMERLFVLSIMTSTVVSVMFWSLETMGAFGNVMASYPPLLNHVQHTLPVLATVTELALHEHKFGSLYSDLMDCIVYMVVYALWMSVCRLVNGWWAYKFLEEFGLRDWAMFVVVVVAFSSVCHMAGRALSAWWHSGRSMAAKGKE